MNGYEVSLIDYIVYCVYELEKIGITLECIPNIARWNYGNAWLQLDVISPSVYRWLDSPLLGESLCSRVDTSVSRIVNSDAKHWPSGPIPKLMIDSYNHTEQCLFFIISKHMIHTPTIQTHPSDTSFFSAEAIERSHKYATFMILKKMRAKRPTI